MGQQFLMAAAGAVALTGSALAADLPRAAPPPAYIPPPPLFSWTGIYVGGQIGYAWGAGNFNDSGFDPITGTFISGTLGSTPSGVIGGAHLGYDGTSLSNTAVAVFPVAFGGSTLTAHSTADVQGSIRGKAGIALDRVLIYGTGGVAFGGFNTDFTLSAPNFIPPFFDRQPLDHPRGLDRGGRTPICRHQQLVGLC
jgi:outer membrane immunogenic protein